MAEKKSNTRYFIIGGFAILIIALGYLGWKFNEQKKDNEAQVEALNYQSDRLTSELEDMYVKLDSLNVDNDSLNIKVKSTQARIQQFLKIQASSAMKIRVYEKELVTLRKVMRSYIVQIDSLQQMNTDLKEENFRVKEQISQKQKESDQLAEKNEGLQKQVEQASVIKTRSIEIIAITKSSKPTTKLKKVEKFKVCFTLLENAIAERGPKEVFVRIARPDELVLVKSANNLFKFSNEDIAFSASREVEYEGTELEICIFYDVDEGELIPGTYYVDLFSEGNEIGTSSFSIK
ncbi:hypothetical protein ACFLSI_04480 [Bacteroidota bacterium]